jgi:hypothetical protein
MKKVLLIFIILLIVVACKKKEISPEGPTDVRIRNLTDLPFIDVVVNISGEEITFGEINSRSVSDYHRFKKAYPKAEISAKINGEAFSTGTVDYTYLNYFGQVQLTYEVFIENVDNKKLKINNIILEAALDLK